MGDDWADLSPNGRYAVLCRAALRQARTDVALSHISAANEYGAPMWDLDMTQVHLTRTDHRAGSRGSRHRAAPRPAPARRRRPPRRCHDDECHQDRTRADDGLDVEHALVEIDHLLQRKLTDAGAAARAVCIDD
jgi:hypothetical protein